MSQESPTGFVADVALRLLPPQRRRHRVRLAVAAGLALLIEGAVFVAVWRERSFVPPPEPQEIPVEVVVETPTPTPTPTPQASPTPEPTPTQSPEPKPQEYEKPATDAPREGKSDHDDETVGDKQKPAAPRASPEPTPTESAAPSPQPTPMPSESPAPPSSPEPTPTPSESAAPSPEPTPTASQPAETPAPELPKTDQADTPQPTKTDAPQPEKTETPKPPAKPATVAGLPKSFADVPDVDFGGVAAKSDITGGNARATYFSKLYGLIVPRMRVPPIAKAYGRTLHGVLAFEIDGRGRLVQRGIRQGSGSIELDEAAMEAVGAASRSFPPPPRHASMVIDFTYSSSPD